MDTKHATPLGPSYWEHRNTPDGQLSFELACERLQAAVHANACDKGWWNGSRRDAADIISRLALVHAEASEAVECVRNGDYAPRVDGNGKPEGLPSELADIVIRVMDLAGGLGINLGEAITAKALYNTKRPYRHGGKLA